MKIPALACLLALALPLAARAEGPAAPAPAPAPAAVADGPVCLHGPGWTFSVAPRLALAVPTSKLGAMAAGGLELAWALPVLEKKLLVAFDAGFTRPSHEGGGTDARVGGAYSFALHEKELKLGLAALYRVFGADKKLVPFFGAGPMLHLLGTTQTTDLAPGENTEQSTQLGFEVVGGVDYRLGPGMLLGEVRFAWSGLNHLFTGDVNAGNVLVGVGYRFVL